MVSIVSQPTTVIECNKCRSVLKYQPIDVKTSVSSVYCGFFTPEYYVTNNYIECPACKHKVIL